VNPQREHAGERAQADGHDEQHGEHQLVDAAEQVHQPPRRLRHPPRRDVAGA